MKLPLRFLFGAILLLISVHRLPAPISEIPESPTPAPAKTKSKPSSKAQTEFEASEESVRPSTSPTQKRTSAQQTESAGGTQAGKKGEERISFAGSWRGIVTCIAEGQSTQAQWTIVVSNDERRVVESAGGASMGYPCYRQGNVLHIAGKDDLGQKANGTLQLDRGTQTVTFNQTTSAHILFVGAAVTYSGRMARESGR